jgi:2-keto-4-pentenoate hydratase/2-oxohepta-3-ene-1,7-dioic acid hydratase in catechol pathway
MKLCRFQPLEFSSSGVGRSAHPIYPPPRAGIIEDGVVWEILGELWRDRERTGHSWPLEAVKLLPPSVPGKIICLGRNYIDHATEMGVTPPKEPIIFLKPPSSVIGPEEPIVHPRISHKVDYEGELALVIGRRFRHLRASDDPLSFVLGYTCFNDVTARDIQRSDGQWTRGKSFDTFCPFGPLLETQLNPADTLLETYLNGVRKQSVRGSEMIFSVDAIIRFIAQVMTLEPGDVIATGTPSGVGSMVTGDVVEVSVSGVGTLRNPVMGPLDAEALDAGE